MTRNNEEDVILYQDHGDMEALNRLVENNEAFIRFILNQHKTTDIQGHVIDDIIQEARVTIMKCAKSFDASRNMRFTTPLSTALTRMIRRRLREYRERRLRYKPIEDSRSYINNGFEAVDQLETIDAIKLAARKTLTDREYAIMMALLVDERTLADVGNHHRLSTERVRQISFMAISRTRAELKRTGSLTEGQ